MRRAALLAAAAGLGGCGPPAPVVDEPRVSELPSAPIAARPDAEDRDPRLRRRAREAVAARAALQHLPWTASHLAIDLERVTSDGRLVLLVQSDRGDTSARRAYRAFLERFGDDGRAYLPHFPQP